MKLYDMCCPRCKHLNRGLYLEETDGWMECENCGTLVRMEAFPPDKIIPVFGSGRLTQVCAAAH